MLRKSRNNEPEPAKDADIERWFQALGEPPVAHEPLGARLSMLARIEQHRKRWWGISWLPTLATPSLVAGLTAGLLLSLAFNLSSVNDFLWPNRSDTQLVASTPSGLPTYGLQRRMQLSILQEEMLANRVPDRSPVQLPGFMPPDQRPIFFRIGKLYADALTALHNDAADIANQHLAWLAEDLRQVKAPDALTQYIDMITTQVREQPSQSNQWRDILTGFEPFYHDAYTFTTPSVASLLFELGAWSEHLYLAATTGDVQGVKQGRPTQNVHRTLQPLNLPPEHWEWLDQLLSLMDKPNL